MGGIDYSRIKPIGPITQDEALEFLRKSRADKEQVNIHTTACVWMCHKVNNEVVGVIGKSKTKHWYRPKGLYVLPKHRLQGIGFSLLMGIIDLDPERSHNAFATRGTQNMYKLLGFEQGAVNEYNIMFVKRYGPIDEQQRITDMHKKDRKEYERKNKRSL